MGSLLRCAVAFPLIVGTAAASPPAAEPPAEPASRDVVLPDAVEALRVRDREFARAAFTLLETRTKHVDPKEEVLKDGFRAMKYGGQPFDAGEPGEPYDVRTSAVSTVTLLGDEVVLEQRPVPSDDPQVRAAGPVAGRWRTELVGTAAATVLDGEEYMMRMPTGASGWLLRYKALQAQAMMGVGLGGEIESVRDLAAGDGETSLSGTMRFGTKTVGEFEMTLDDDLIVRRCVVWFRTPTTESVTTILTRGRAESPGFPATASSGTIVRRDRVLLPNFTDPVGPRAWGEWTEMDRRTVVLRGLVPPPEGATTETIAPIAEPDAAHDLSPLSKAAGAADVSAAGRGDPAPPGTGMPLWSGLFGVAALGFALTPYVRRDRSKDHQ